MVAPVTVTEQLVPDRVHVEEEKETEPVPDWVQVTVSPDIEPEFPVTVAVQVDVPPTATEVGVQETDVEVTA